MSEKKTNEKKLEPMASGQCIWVDAGVISYRLCTLNYDCEHCSLHQALIDGPVQVPTPSVPALNHKETEERRAEFDRLFHKLPAAARKCRYMLTGDVSYKLCVDQFKCASCSFGQMMEDTLADEDVPGLGEGDVLTIAGLRLAGGVHYHRGHLWVRVERAGNVCVGLDDYGQQLLGRIVNVHLPVAGQPIFEGASACDLRTDQGGIEIPTPISGQVIARNTKLLEQPGLVNESPYTGGWLYRVRPSNLQFELASLLYGREAKSWFELEIERAKERLQQTDRNQANLTMIEKGAIWRTNHDSEMVSELLLATSKKAA